MQPCLFSKTESGWQKRFTMLPPSATPCSISALVIAIGSLVHSFGTPGVDEHGIKLDGEFPRFKFSKMGTDQLRTLSTAHIVAMTSAQMAALTTEQVQALTTTQLAAIETGDLRAMLTSQIAAFTSDQVPAFTTAQAAALTTQQVAALGRQLLHSALALADLLALLVVEIETRVVQRTVAIAQAEPQISPRSLL